VLTTTCWKSFLAETWIGKGLHLISHFWLNDTHRNNSFESIAVLQDEAVWPCLDFLVHIPLYVGRILILGLLRLLEKSYVA